MGRKLTVTRRPTYRDAVQWIALNDDPDGSDEVAEVQGMISVLLVADLFGAEPRNVAIDVIRTRHGAGPFAIREEARQQ